jgi:hypothetical protein
VAAESARVNGASTRLSESASTLTGSAAHVAGAPSALPGVIGSVFTQQRGVRALPNGRDLCENRRARREMTGGGCFLKGGALGKVS